MRILQGPSDLDAVDAAEVIGHCEKVLRAVHADLHSPGRRDHSGKESAIADGRARPDGQPATAACRG